MCKTNKKFEMIMFDMDGTLIDSFLFHSKCFQKVFETFNLYLTVDEVGEYIGNTLKVILDATLPGKLHKEAMTRLTDFYIKDADELIAELNLIDGARETVQCLRQNGFKTALLSNSKFELVEKILDIKDLMLLFDDYKGADITSLDKISRCLGMLKTHRIHPNKVLYVGDTSYDVTFAKKAGMKSCLVLNDLSWIHKENIEIEKVEADYMIENLRQVISLI